MRILFFLFVLVPIAEMAVLIKVGSLIGVFYTIGLVLLTAVIGVALLRQQGLSTLLRAKSKMETGEIPAREMVEAIFLAVGGALLLTPGFITDAIGFCCLLPGIRQVLIGWGLRHVVLVRGFSTQGGPVNKASSDGKSNVIEGDYKRED